MIALFLSPFYLCLLLISHLVNCLSLVDCVSFLCSILTFVLRDNPSLSRIFFPEYSNILLIILLSSFTFSLLSYTSHGWSI